MSTMFALNKCMERNTHNLKKMKCPECGRRAFDISDFPKEEIEVKLKCPQCNKFVCVPCTKESQLKMA